MAPRRRPPWWPTDEPWPPAGWAPGRSGPRGPDGAWSRHGPPWARDRHHGGGPLLAGVVLRAIAFLLLSVVLVTLVGYVGAAVVGVATAPLGVVGVGLAAIVLVVAGLAVAWRALRRAGRPLERLVDAAGRVEAGDLTVRVPEEGSAGMRSLVRSFNQMSARLEAADTTRRTFLADVSHELRTPLTVIRGQAEAIADGVYPADAAHLQPILEQTALLERLVADLRTVALAEAGALEVHATPIDLVELARSVVDGMRPAADAAGVTMTVTPIVAGARVHADPALLQRLVLNLLSNAVRHTPRNGTIQVTVTAEQEGTTLSVVDSGPGIPAELRERVFDRFVRGPGSGGSGLGLAIARDIAQAHGGTLVAESHEAGGTRMVLSLPSAADDRASGGR